MQTTAMPLLHENVDQHNNKIGAKDIKVTQQYTKIATNLRVITH